MQINWVNNIYFSVTTGQYDDRNFTILLATRKEIRDRHIHMSLENDLVEHMWEKFGSSYAD